MINWKNQNRSFALLLISSLLLPLLIIESHADETSVTEKRCKAHVKNYIKLGETEYKERYKHNSIVDYCIKLFKDPESNLFVELKSITVKSKQIVVEKKDSLFNIITNSKVGEKIHLIKYQVCNNEKESKKKIFFQTNSEKSIILLPKNLSPKLCTIFWIQLASESMDSIKMSWATDDIKIQKIRKII